MASPTIAVVGAGLYGLVLARILQLHGLASTVYELDAAADARSKGGSLDVHEESGQHALREAGLYEEFRRLTQPQGESLCVLDKTGTVFVDYAPDDGEGGRPEIDRTALHDLLVASLDPGQIVWGHKVTAVRDLDDGLGDWSTELTDLVRNCDDGIVPRLIHALPVGHFWTRIAGVTLVGDAAHVMSPCAGEGANLAMLDATELALALVRHGDDVETALTRYEAAMFPRPAAAAEASARAWTCASPRTPPRASSTSSPRHPNPIARTALPSGPSGSKSRSRDKPGAAPSSSMTLEKVDEGNRRHRSPGRRAACAGGIPVDERSRRVGRRCIGR